MPSNVMFTYDTASFKQMLCDGASRGTLPKLTKTPHRYYFIGKQFHVRLTLMAIRPKADFDDRDRSVFSLNIEDRLDKNPS